MANGYTQEPLGNFMPGNDGASLCFEFPDFVDLAQSVPRAFGDSYAFASGDSLPMNYQNAPIPHPAPAEFAWDDFQLSQPGFLTATAPGREDQENDYLPQSIAYDSLSIHPPAQSTAPG